MFSLYGQGDFHYCSCSCGACGVGWKAGLKTGMYYLRTKAAADAIKFTVDQEALKASEKKKELQKIAEKNLADMVCSLENKDACISCSG